MHFQGIQWKADTEDWNIVNTSVTGGSTHYGVKLWCGKGYVLDLFSVYADDCNDALCRVAEWCVENSPWNLVSSNRVQEMMGCYQKENPNLSYEEIWDSFGIYEWVTQLENGLYVRTENMFVAEWPSNVPYSE